MAESIEFTDDSLIYTVATSAVCVFFAFWILKFMESMKKSGFKTFALAVMPPCVFALIVNKLESKPMKRIINHPQDREEDLQSSQQLSSITAEKPSVEDLAQVVNELLDDNEIIENTIENIARSNAELNEALSSERHDHNKELVREYTSTKRRRSSRAGSILHSGVYTFCFNPKDSAAMVEDDIKPKDSAELIDTDIKAGPFHKLRVRRSSLAPTQYIP